MQPLDHHTLERALGWIRQGQPVWLCSVLATYGSSPRPPGALLVANAAGEHAGSLSGGCIEDDFLTRLREGEFSETPRVLRYGESGEERERLRLPCGGLLEVLVERLPAHADSEAQLVEMLDILGGGPPRLREVTLDSGDVRFVADTGSGSRIERHPGYVRLRLAPSQRLLIAGISPVTRYCAEFARALDFEVIVCDPREAACRDFDVADVRVECQLPSQLIPTTCHAGTAIVALTHDPRIDDLAMIEAVRTPAFYIGVMGSRQTSQARAARLKRSGGLDDDDVARLHMPIGLALGSKTPAEIALAVMADILRVRHAIPRGGV